MGRNLERELKSCLPRTVRLRALPFFSILPHLNRAKASFLLPSKTQLASRKGDDDPAGSTEEHQRLVGADGWHGRVCGHTPAVWRQVDKGHMGNTNRKRSVGATAERIGAGGIHVSSLTRASPFLFPSWYK